MIEYYESTINPGCYFVAINEVLVGMWINNRWIDRGIYRPVRYFYKKIEWTGTAYDRSLLSLDEFEIVKNTKREVKHGDD